MKKIIRLSESDIERLVKRVVKEQQSQQTKTISHGNNAESFRNQLKALGVVSNPEITMSPTGVTIKYTADNSAPSSLSFIYSNNGLLQDVLDKVKASNTITKTISACVGGLPGYVLVIQSK
jgi:hypothetical protein